MSDEQQLDDSDFGIRGIEKSQGYTEMPIAHPAPNSDDLPTESIMTEDELAHAKRPVEADWGHAIERDFFDVATGERKDSREVVSKEDAAHGLTQAREAELKAIENEAREALSAALDGTDQPQPEQPPELEPQAESFEAHHDAKWAEADKAIEAMLAEPYVRERIEQSFNQVRQEAAAKAEQTSRLAEAMQAHYQQATNNLTAEANALLLAQFPELASRNADELRGKLEMLQQSNPQRAQAFTQLATRAQQIAQAQQRQMDEHRMGLALKQEYEMKQYAEAETRKFEAAVANESPETVRAVRENVWNVAERHYGVPKETLQALYSGEQQVSSAALMRSSAFQQMVFDAVRFRLGQQSLRDHAVRPVQNVQRPGVAAERPKVYDGDLSAAASRFNLPGGAEGQQGIRNAAAYLTAKRARG